MKNILLFLGGCGVRDAGGTVAMEKDNGLVIQSERACAFGWSGTKNVGYSNLVEKSGKWSRHLSLGATADNA